MWQSAFRCGEMACTRLPAFLSLQKKHETEDYAFFDRIDDDDLMWHS